MPFTDRINLFSYTSSLNKYICVLFKHHKKYMKKIYEKFIAQIQY